MSEQPLERASVRAMVKWAKVVVRQGGGQSRAMRRAQGRLVEALVRESAAPAQAANDAAMVVLMGDTGTSDREQTLRLTRPAQAAQTVDRIVELLTPPTDTDQSLDAACSAFRDYLKAGADQQQWPSYRALVRLQIAVWHHTGVDPSPAVKALVATVAEDGPPEHPDAVVKAAVAACIEATHDQFAAQVLDEHGGPEGIRESMDLEDGTDLRLLTAFPPAGTRDPEPDAEPPGVGDVVEPIHRLLAVVPDLADDMGDVLEHMDAGSAPKGVPCSKVRWRKMAVETVVEDNLVRAVMRCTCRQLSDPDPAVAECIACGSRDCPHGHELHYHHDGCPDCIREEETREPN